MAITYTSTSTSATISANGLDIITTDSSGNVSVRTNNTLTPLSQLSTIKYGLSQDTSGSAAYDFQIPVGVKRISVLLKAVSTNGTSQLAIRIGTDTVATSGYDSAGYTDSNGRANYANGFVLEGAGSVNATRSGKFTIDLFVNPTGYNYVLSGGVGQTTSVSALGSFQYAGGYVTLPSLINILRIQAANGSDLFDAGTVSVTWEY